MNTRVKIIMSLVAAILISVPIWALHRITENRTYDPDVPVRKARSLIEQLYPGSTARVVCTQAGSNPYVFCTAVRDGADPISLRCSTSTEGECYMATVR